MSLQEAEVASGDSRKAVDTATCICFFRHYNIPIQCLVALWRFDAPKYLN